MSTGDTFLVLSSFLASAVEMVEVLTIVLAAGIARGWRSSLTGLAAASAVLAVIVAVARPGADVAPAQRSAARGRRAAAHLRPAVAAQGDSARERLKALHDEDAIFSRELAEAREPPTSSSRVSTLPFLLAFKGVLLEGLEVVFIVLTFGSTQGSSPSRLRARGAFVVVASVGMAIRAPLAHVPENTLKFAVGRC